MIGSRVVPAARLLQIALTVILLLQVSNAQDMPPTLVVTEKMQKTEFNDQITLIGRTSAVTFSKIVSEVAGRVIAVSAPEGNEIKKGQPLIKIDPVKIRLSLKAKEAEAAQALAQSDLAKANYRRVTELFAQKLVPETTLDSADAWGRITEETFNALDAERGLLAQDVANCVIRAPYTGYTLRKKIDVGEWVDPGTTVYEMVDLSKVTVYVDLPERYFGHLSIGSEVSIAVSSDTLPPMMGEVTGIARSASEDTHTFPVIVTVDNSGGRLGGGSLVKATLSLKETFTSMAVSKDAIVRQGLQTSIYTVVDGKATNMPVTIKSTRGNLVAISGNGLSEGMPVVVRGNERIFPGSPVTVAGDDSDFAEM